MRTVTQTLLAGVLFAACGGGKHAEATVKDVKEPNGPAGQAIATIAVTSTAFAANGEIPSEHTCEGADVMPPLAWSGVPAGAKALVLIVDDPDAPDPKAPKRVWVHYVASLAAGATSTDGAVLGSNDWGKAAWGGPCPPIGRHRYVFKLYAVDAAVDAAGKDKAAVLAAIDGHVLARGELIGTYQKKK